MNTTASHTITAPIRISPFQAFKGWVGGLLARAAAGLTRQAINRRVLYQLGGMSDRELRDIGLVRQDVVDAATLSPETDAASLLVARRDERRGTRRRGC